MIRAHWYGMASGMAKTTAAGASYMFNHFHTFSKTERSNWAQKSGCQPGRKEQTRLTATGGFQPLRVGNRSQKRLQAPFEFTRHHLAIRALRNHDETKGTPTLKAPKEKTKGTPGPKAKQKDMPTKPKDRQLCRGL